MSIISYVGSALRNPAQRNGAHHGFRFGNPLNVPGMFKEAADACAHDGMVISQKDTDIRHGFSPKSYQTE
jgi:hypothetical protein